HRGIPVRHTAGVTMMRGGGLLRSFGCFTKNRPSARMRRISPPMNPDPQRQRMYSIEKTALGLTTSPGLLALATAAAAQQPAPKPTPARPAPPAQHQAPAPAPQAQAAPASVDQNPQRTTASYGDWVVRCEVVAGPPPQKNCDMEQLAQVQGQTNPISR